MQPRQGIGRTRSGVARRRADLCWNDSRRLVLVDVENVVGGACNTSAKARWARRTIDDAIGSGPDDHVVVATDACGMLCAGLAWPDARRLVGYGKDGADDQLLMVLDEDVARRFRHVVLVSGDGIFADAVAGLTGQGVEVTVLAHRAGLSARWRRAASQVVGIMDARRPAI